MNDRAKAWTEQSVTVTPLSNSDDITKCVLFDLYGELNRVFLGPDTPCDAPTRFEIIISERGKNKTL